MAICFIFGSEGLPGFTFYAQQRSSHADQILVSAEEPEGLPIAAQQVVSAPQAGACGTKEGALVVPRPRVSRGGRPRKVRLLAPHLGRRGAVGSRASAWTEQVLQAPSEDSPEILEQALEKIESIQLAVTRADRACTRDGRALR